MLKSDIGINAGVIWKLLSDKGSLSTQEIAELTGYKMDLILLAVGWLARENKIRFFYENETLRLELNQSSSNLYY